MVGQRYQAKVLCMGFCLLTLCGCSIWESYAHPDYSSSRAERICHPFGDCSQGVWVSDEGLGFDAEPIQWQCAKLVNRSHGNGWMKGTVVRGMEKVSCMEDNGFSLKQ